MTTVNNLIIRHCLGVWQGALHDGREDKFAELLDNNPAHEPRWKAHLNSLDFSDCTTLQQVITKIITGAPDVNLFNNLYLDAPVNNAGVLLNVFHIGGGVTNTQSFLQYLKTHQLAQKLGKPWTTILINGQYDLSGASENTVKEFKKRYIDTCPLTTVTDEQLEKDIQLLAGKNIATANTVLPGGALTRFHDVAGVGGIITPLTDEQKKRIKTRAVLEKIENSIIRAEFERRDYDFSAATQPLIDSFNDEISDVGDDPASLTDAFLNLHARNLAKDLNGIVPAVVQLCAGGDALAFTAMGGGLTLEQLARAKTHEVLKKIHDTDVRQAFLSRNYDLSGATDITIAAFNGHFTGVNNPHFTGVVDPNASLDAWAQALVGLPNVLDFAGNNAVTFAATNFDGGSVARIKTAAVLNAIGEPWKTVLANHDLSGADANRINAFKRDIKKFNILKPFDTTAVNTAVDVLARGAVVVAVPPNPQPRAQTFGAVDASLLTENSIGADNLKLARTRAVLKELGQPWEGILDARQYDLSSATTVTIKNFKENFAGKVASFVPSENLTTADEKKQQIEKRIDVAVKALNGSNDVTLRHHHTPGAVIGLFNSTEVGANPPNDNDLKKIRAAAVLAEIGEPWAGILRGRNFDLSKATSGKEGSIEGFKKWVSDLEKVKPIVPADLNTEIAKLCVGAVKDLTTGIATNYTFNAPLGMYGADVDGVNAEQKVITHAVLAQIDEPWKTILRNRNFDLSGATAPTIKAFKDWIATLTDANLITPANLNAQLQALCGVANINQVFDLTTSPLTATTQDFINVGIGSDAVKVQDYATNMANCAKIKNLKLRELLIKEGNFFTTALKDEKINELIKKINALNTDKNALSSPEKFSEVLYLIDGRFGRQYLKDKKTIWDDFYNEANRLACFAKVPNLYIRKALEASEIDLGDDLAVNTFITRLKGIITAPQPADLAALDIALGFGPPPAGNGSNFLWNHNVIPATPTEAAKAAGLWDSTTNTTRYMRAIQEEKTVKALGKITRNPVLRKTLEQAEDIRDNTRYNAGNPNADILNPLTEEEAKWIDMWLAYVPNLTMDELNTLLQKPIDPNLVYDAATGSGRLPIIGAPEDIINRGLTNEFLCKRGLQAFAQQSPPRKFPPVFVATNGRNYVVGPSQGLANEAPVYNNPAVANSALHTIKANFKITSEQFEQIKKAQKMEALFDPLSTSEECKTAAESVVRDCVSITSGLPPLEHHAESKSSTFGFGRAQLDDLKKILATAKASLDKQNGSLSLSPVDERDPTKLANTVREIENQIEPIAKELEKRRKKLDKLWDQVGGKAEMTEEQVKGLFAGHLLTTKEIDERAKLLIAKRESLKKSEEFVSKLEAEYKGVLATLRAISADLQRKQETSAEQDVAAKKDPIATRNAVLFSPTEGQTVSEAIQSALGTTLSAEPTSALFTNKIEREEGMKPHSVLIYRAQYVKNATTPCVFTIEDEGRTLKNYRVPKRDDYPYFGGTAAYKKDLQKYFDDRTAGYVETRRALQLKTGKFDSSPIYLEASNQEEATASYKGLIKAGWPPSRIVNLSGFSFDPSSLFSRKKSVSEEIKTEIKRERGNMVFDAKELKKFTETPKQIEQKENKSPYGDKSLSPPPPRLKP